MTDTEAASMARGIGKLVQAERKESGESRQAVVEAITKTIASGVNAITKTLASRR